MTEAKNQSETLEAEGSVSCPCLACLMSPVIAVVEAFGRHLAMVEELKAWIFNRRTKSIGKNPRKDRSIIIWGP